MLTYPSAISGSCRMLALLLLPLFISSLTSSTTCKYMHEFRKDVEILGTIVKNCSENCSSVHITDRKCQCLNLNTSQVVCASRLYAIKALKTLNISNDKAIRALITAVRRMDAACPMDFCSLPVKVSPKSLHKKLESLSKELSST